jgi:hypothetical protein
VVHEWQALLLKGNVHLRVPPEAAVRVHRPGDAEVRALHRETVRGRRGACTDSVVGCVVAQ